MEKVGESNRKARKISRVINQAPTHGPKHDEIWAQRVLNILSESMLVEVYGANVPRWNLEAEPFIAQWILQMEKHTHKLGVVKSIRGFSQIWIHEKERKVKLFCNLAIFYMAILKKIILKIWWLWAIFPNNFIVSWIVSPSGRMKFCPFSRIIFT